MPGRSYRPVDIPDFQFNLTSYTQADRGQQARSQRYGYHHREVLECSQVIGASEIDPQIVLINAEALTELMIYFNLGVRSYPSTKSRGSMPTYGGVDEVALLGACCPRHTRDWEGKVVPTSRLRSAQGNV